MKLRSFGCSFVYGTELLSPSDSNWPALMARDLDMDYRCHAYGGAGNLQTMEYILKYCKQNEIAVINWTWIDRFDFIDRNIEKWETLRPALDRPHADWYFQNIHSQYRDMLTNLTYVNTALDFLLERDIQFIMTYMDDLMFESINEHWHDPAAVKFLQDRVRPYMHNFEGMNFLDWSRSKGFAIGEAQHPLETAHRAAADFWMPVLKNLIHK